MFRNLQHLIPNFGHTHTYAHTHKLIRPNKSDLFKVFKYITEGEPQYQRFEDDSNNKNNTQKNCRRFIFYINGVRQSCSVLPIECIDDE